MSNLCSVCRILSQVSWSSASFLTWLRNEVFEALAINSAVPEELRSETILSRCCNEVHQIRPLEDARWREFVAQHPRSSVFHTTAWLEALRRTFDHEPIAFTTSSADTKLKDAIVLCRVNSWITGRRLVSLPFSDHCDPLVGDDTDVGAVLLAVQHELSKNGLRYAEIRPTHELNAVTVRSESIYTYCSHQID